jgi:hypothetical protein
LRTAKIHNHRSILDHAQVTAFGAFFSAQSGSYELPELPRQRQRDRHASRACYHSRP